MLVSPPGRTASEFIDRHRQTLIDEFRCGSPWRAHQHPTKPRPKTCTKNKKWTDSSITQPSRNQKQEPRKIIRKSVHGNHGKTRKNTEKDRLSFPCFSVISVDFLFTLCVSWICLRLRLAALCLPWTKFFLEKSVDRKTFTKNENVLENFR